MQNFSHKVFAFNASSELQGLIQRDYLGITVLCFIFILIQSMFLVYLL